MKALSLKQPYAELVVSGRKSIEIRKWNTKFRGEFLVHASKVSDKKAMKRFGFKESEIELGKIIGKVELVNVKEYLDDKDFKKDYRKHLASSDYGKYGFVLKNSKRINSVKCNGKLNFWEAGDVYS